MKKALLFLLSAIISFSACSCASEKAEDNPPEITVTVNGQPVEYFVGLNLWNGSAYDRLDTLQSVMREDSGIDVAYIKLGGTIAIEFKDDPPASAELYDKIIEKDGTAKYADQVTETHEPEIADGKLSCDFAAHPAAFLSSDSADYEDGNTYRGFYLRCRWDGGNDCEYGFVIRTDAGHAEASQESKTEESLASVPATSSESAGLEAPTEEASGSGSEGASPPNEALLQSGDTASETAGTASGNPDTEDGPEPHESGEPPEHLLFSDYDSFLDLYAILEKGDEEIEEFLSANSYDMNGLRSRSDIERLFADISAVSFPRLEGVPPSGISIYPSHNAIHISYLLSDGVRFLFTVSDEQGSAPNRIPALKADGFLMNDGNDLLSERGIEIGGIELYQHVSESDEAANGQRFVMNVRGTFISVLVSNAADLDAAVDGLTGFSYDMGLPGIVDTKLNAGQ